MSKSDLERLIDVSGWVGALTASISSYLLMDYTKQETAERIVNYFKDKECDNPTILALIEELKQKYNL